MNATFSGLRRVHFPEISPFKDAADRSRISQARSQGGMQGDRSTSLPNERGGNNEFAPPPCPI